MIKLTLTDLPMREIVIPTSGPGQNFYRVLCMAMLEDAGDRVYTVEDLVNRALPKKDLPEQYEQMVKGIAGWAFNKGLRKTSDLKDDEGQPTRPYGWTAANWKCQLRDDQYNRAVKVINEAQTLHQDCGQEGDTYWYAQTCGVIRVPASLYDDHIQRVNEAHALIKDNKDLTEEEAFERVGLPLEISALPDKQQEPISWKLIIPFNKKTWALVAVVTLFFTGVASFQTNFWDTLRTKGLVAAKEEHSNYPERNEVSQLYRDAWIAYKSGDYETARTLARIILGNPEHENYRGNCYYLMSEVSLSIGNYDLALNYLEKAEGFSKYKNSRDLLPYIYWGYSRYYLFTAKWDQTIHFADQMREESIAFEPHYYWILAWVSAILEQDFISSISLMAEAISILEERNEKGTTQTFVADLAIFYALNGDFSNASEYINNVDLFIGRQKQVDEVLFLRNRIAYSVLHRCMGLGKLNSMENQILAYRDENGNDSLTIFWDLVNALSCRREHEETQK
jgi:tetratricopeptide (TPR) repeat protein